MFIEVILYDGFDELDGLAPYEVFRTAEALGAPIRAELVGDARVAEGTRPERRNVISYEAPRDRGGTRDDQAARSPFWPADAP